MVDKQNNLWFLSNGSLYKYDQGKDLTEKINIKASCIAVGFNKDLWIGKNNGTVVQYNLTNKTLKTVSMFNGQTSPDQRSISKIYPVSDTQVLVGCFSQGLKLYDMKTASVRSLTLGNSENSAIYVRDITRGSRDKYWIATNQASIFMT